MVRPKRSAGGSIMRKLKEHNERIIKEAEEKKRQEQEREKNAPND